MTNYVIVGQHKEGQTVVLFIRTTTPEAAAEVALTSPGIVSVTGVWVNNVANRIRYAA